MRFVVTVAETFEQSRFRSLSKATVWPADLAIVAAGIATYVFAQDYMALAAIVVTMMIFAISLDMVTGYGGIETLGHSAFFGTGDYAAGLYAKFVTGEPISGLFVAAMVAALVGVTSGLLVLRVRALSAVMLTLAVATVLLQFANIATPITGGADGLTGYQIAPLLGYFSFDLWGKTAYTYCCVVFVVTFVICRVVMNSTFGLTIRGIKENELRMRLLGVPIRRRLLSIYTFSAAIAGISGALTAQITGLVGLDSLSFVTSGNVLFMLVIGGSGRLYGAILGAIVFVVFSDRAAAIDPINWLFALGLLLILTVQFAPDGLLGLAETVWRKVRGNG